MLALLASNELVSPPPEPSRQTDSVEVVVPPPGEAPNWKEAPTEDANLRRKRLEETSGKEKTFTWVRLLNHYEKISLDFWKRPWVLNAEDKVVGEKWPLLFLHANNGWLLHLGKNSEPPIIGTHSSLSLWWPQISEHMKKWKSMTFWAAEYDTLSGAQKPTVRNGQMVYPQASETALFFGVGKLLNYPWKGSWIQDHRLGIQYLLAPFRWRTSWFSGDAESSNRFLLESLVVCSYALSLHRLVSVGVRLGLSFNIKEEERFFFNFQIGTDILRAWKPKTPWWKSSTGK